MKFDLAKIVSVFAVIIFPLSLFWLAYQYKVDEFNYIERLREDRPIEWLTFGLLILAAILAIDITIQIRQRQGVIDWFFVAFALFCFVVALEEISWGQRVLDFQSPELFLTKSDQQEINVHNLLQQQLNFKTKDVAGLALFVYGFALPLFTLNRRLGASLAHAFRLPPSHPRHLFRLLLPPRVLLIGFLLGGLLMLDEPTGFEEEIGELFFALCFMLFMLLEALDLRQEGEFRPFRVGRLSVLSAGAASRVTILGLTLAGLAARLWGIDAKGLDWDEATVALMAQAPLGEILRFHWQAGLGYSPLWAVTLHLWSPLAGDSEMALRLLPAFACVLTIPLFWQLLRLLWPDEPGLTVLASVLLICAPVLWLAGQSSLPYALVTMLGVLSLYMAVRLAARSRWATAACFVAANWLLLGFHMLGSLLILVEALFFALLALRAGKGRSWLPLLAVALSSLPLLLWFWFAPGYAQAVAELRGAEEAGRTLFRRLDELWRDLTFGSQGTQPRQAGLGWLLAPLLAIGVIDLLLRPRAQTGQADRAAWGWLFVLLLVTPVVAALALFDQLASPYLIWIVPALYALVALGIVRLWQTIRLLGMTGALMAGFVALSAIVYSQGAYAASDYRVMARELADSLADGAGAVVLAAPSQHPLARYYIADAPLYAVPETALTGFWPLTGAPIVPEAVDDQIKGYLARYPRLWLVLAGAAAVDPGEFLPKYLTAVAFKEDCDRWSDVELCRYTSPDFVQPLQQQAMDVVFAGEMLLEHAAVGLTAPRNHDEAYVLVTLDWTTLARPTADYKVTLRLVDADGQAVEQSDDFPIGPLLPPTTWVEHDDKVSFRAVEAPADAPPGLYSLELGVYDPATAELATHTEGDSAPSTALIRLATLRIGDGLEILPADAAGQAGR